MKASKRILLYICFITLVFFIGCETPEQNTPAENDKTDPLSLYTSYTPQKIDILPLTKILPGPKNKSSRLITVYLTLLDAFNCSIKSPGTFRFELYKYVERSPQPKGQRVMLWPNIDLTEPADNNRYWRDYFRAYRFSLEFAGHSAAPGRGHKSNQSYILQVTYLIPGDRRLSDHIILKSEQ